MIETDIRDYRGATIALGIIALVLMAGVLIIGAMASGSEEKSDEINADYAMLNALETAQGAIQKDLSETDLVVANGAGEIGQSGPEGDNSLAILSGMSSSGPAAIDAITTDLNGTIVAVRPDRYKEVIGADIHNQSHIQRLFERKIPVMSDLFTTVEGFPAVDIASPVFSPGGKFLGAATLLIDPETLIGRDLPTADGGAPWDTWVVQKDGTILYAPAGNLVGTSIFNDSVMADYPYLGLSRNLTNEWQGNAVVTVTGTQGTGVTSHVVWTTVGIRGTEWRIVFSRAATNPRKLSDILNQTII